MGIGVEHLLQFRFSLLQSDQKMERFTTSIARSVESRNYHAGIALALTIPDICSRLSSVNNQTNGYKYAAWFNKYVGEKYKSTHPLTRKVDVFMDGDVCYALRCAMLHQGDVDLASQRVKTMISSIHFTAGSAHCTRIDSILQLDTGLFCRDICLGVSDWMHDFKVGHKDWEEKLSSLVQIHTETSSLMGGAVVFEIADPH